MRKGRKGGGGGGGVLRGLIDDFFVYNIPPRCLLFFFSFFSLSSFFRKHGIFITRLLCPAFSGLPMREKRLHCIYTRITFVHLACEKDCNNEF